jgi:glycosyltransferase involved in cell wall biosynthesis
MRHLEKEKLKILVVTNMYPCRERPYYGVFVRDQVESLRRLGVDVDVFFINGISDKKNYLKAPFRLYKLLKSQSYHVIHAHHSYAVLVVWLVRFFISNSSPLLFTFHEPEFLKPKEFIPTKSGIFGKLIVSKKLKRFALNRADYVITVWRGLLEALNFKKPYEVLPCGVDLNKFKPIPKSEARLKVGWNLHEKIIFFPGDKSRRREKGADLIEKAVEILQSKGIKIRVEFADNIPHHEMPFYMAAADVIVHPSRFEASPMVIKETLACGKPLVTSDVGDIGEIAAGVHGVIFVKLDPVDVACAIEEAFKIGVSSEGRDRIFKLGLSEKDVAKRLIQIYKKLLAKHDKGRYC